MCMFMKIFDYLINCTPLGGVTRYRILREVGSYLNISPRQVLLTGRKFFQTLGDGSIYDNKMILCRYAYVSTTPLKKYNPVFTIVKEGHVLDYGSGIGICFDEIRNKTEYKKYFLDIPGPAFDFVRSKYPDGEFIEAAGADLGISKFDLIVITDVLEHLIDPVSVLKGVIKAIKPGGYLLYYFSENTSKPGHVVESIQKKPICDAMLRKEFIEVCRLPALPVMDFLQKKMAG